jgi:O-antigen/teichoic acid export membrane protein
MSRSRRAIFAILTRYLGMAIAAIVGFAAVPIVLHHVSKSDYGLWITLGEAVGYLTILDFGTGSAITRMVARLGADPDPVQLNRLFSTALLVSTIFAFVFFGAGATLLALLPAWHAIPPERLSLAKSLLILMIARGALTFPIRVAANTLVGLQRQAFLNFCGIAGTLAAPATYVILLQHGVGLIALPIGMLVSTAVGSMPAFLVLKAVVPRLRLSYRNADWSQAKSLFNWSFFLFINNIAVIIIYYTDNVVIASNLDLSAVSVYTLTARLVLYWLPLLVALPDSMMPGLIDLYKIGAHERFRDVYLRVLRVVIAFSVGIAVVACCVNQRFVSVWVGPQNYGGLLMTIVFAATFVDRAYRQVSSLVVVSTGRIQGVAYMSVLEALLNLTLSLTLVRFLGALGVALGTLLAEWGTGSWYVPMVVARELKSTVWQCLGEPFLRPIMAGTGAVGFAIFLRRVIPASTWPSLAMYSILIGTCYLTMLASLEFRRNGWSEWMEFLRLSRGTSPHDKAPAGISN